MTDITMQVGRLAEAMLARGWFLASAESCTGGLIAAACTELAGSSAWFDRGFVTYSYEAKTDLLGVDAQLLIDQGAVSEAVATVMARGALQRSRAHLAVAVTGIAGPSGGTDAKPVGTVWFAWACRTDGGDARVRAQVMHFDGDRSAVRSATVDHALRGLLIEVGGSA